MATVPLHGRPRRTALVALAAASAAAAGCGGDDGGGRGERPAAASSPVVEMADLRFDPPALAVRRGETVTFRNVGKVTHNAKGRGFFSRVVQPGGSYRHRFDAAGSFDYVCTFHPGMEGTITVRG